MSIQEQSDNGFLSSLERKFVHNLKKYGLYSYPEWLEFEKERRATNADPEYYCSAISLTFLTPNGTEHTYKYYQFQKKKLTIEDFVRAIRSCEDRYLIELPKASFLQDMTDNINFTKTLEEIQLRYKNYAQSKEHEV